MRAAARARHQLKAHSWLRLHGQAFRDATRVSGSGTGKCYCGSSEQQDWLCSSGTYSTTNYMNHGTCAFAYLAPKCYCGSSQQQDWFCSSGTYSTTNNMNHGTCAFSPFARKCFCGSYEMMDSVCADGEYTTQSYLNYGTCNFQPILPMGYEQLFPSL